MTTPKTALVEIAEGQENKYATHNEALRQVDQLLQLHVIDRDLDEPPGSPSEGNAYIVASAPSAGSPWAGETRNIAYYSQSQWEFITPADGWVCWINDEQVQTYYSSAVIDWVASDPYKLTVTYISATTSLTNADVAKAIGVKTSAGNVTVYLPDASSVGNGFITAVFKATTDANTVTVDGNGFDINGSASYDMPDAYDSIYLITDGSTRWQTLVKDVRTDTVLDGIEFKGYSETFVSIAVSATGDTIMSLASANVFSTVLDANASVVFGNVPAGKAVSATIFVEQDGTGNYSMNVQGAIYASGHASVVTQTANAKDMWTYVTKDGGTTWYGSRAGGKFV